MYFDQFDCLIDTFNKKWMNLIEHMVKIHPKLFEINPFLTLIDFVSPILSSDFESDQIWMTNLSSYFKL